MIKYILRITLHVCRSGPEEPQKATSRTTDKPENMTTMPLLAVVGKCDDL